MMKYEVVEGIFENSLCFLVFFFLVRLWVIELEGCHSFKESVSGNANCGRFMVI